MKRFFLFFCIPSMIFFGEKTFSQELKPNPQLDEVVVVFKTHFDIGYTDYAESVIRKYGSSMIEGALENLDASMKLPPEERFVWTLPGWPMQEILERGNPVNKNRVETALKNGNFVIHALPFTLETEASDLENIVRGFEISSSISEKYGLELPRDAKMTDVPSHSWALPTILKNAGVDFLHLGCNAASQSPDVPLLFWWEGPDGSRLMTMYYPDYYGTDLVSPPDWPFKSWLALIPTNDNQGAPPPDEVRRTMEKIRELAPNAKITTGRMSDFYDALMKEKPDLPVISGDMPDSWIHGYMSMPREMKTSRRMHKDIYALEALSTQLNGWTGSKIDLTGMIFQASVNSLLFDEHTFGLAISHGHSGRWAYGDEFRYFKTEGVYKPLERSWKDKGDRVYEAERKIRPNYEYELVRLSEAINTDKNHITVYNPLPWKRSGIVELQVHSDIIQGSGLKDAYTGEIVPMSNRDNIVTFPAKDVPSMGYKTYIPVKQESNEKNLLSVNQEENIIENEYFKIQLDPDRGRIGSIIDNRTGKELVKQDSEYGFGNYFYERFSKQETERYARAYIKGGWNWAPAEMGRPGLDDTPYKAVKQAQARVSYINDPLEVKAIMYFDKDSDVPHNYTIIVSLSAGQPYVEMRWGIHGKEPEPWPEAGWIPFSLNIEDPEFKAGRLGAVVDPATDFIDNSNFDYYFLNTGIAVLDDQGNGVGISSPDAPGISLDRPGLWRFSGKFIPEEANVFFNLYNNQWSTNFTEWIEGSWNIRFYIWSINGYENEKDLITPSEEFQSPLLAAFSQGRKGSLPVQNQGISLSRKGILVTALSPENPGEGTILRCWEQAGISGDCIVSLPEALQLKQAWPVNLRGEKTGEMLEIRDNEFNFKVETWKPHSFLLK